MLNMNLIKWDERNGGTKRALKMECPKIKNIK